MARWRDWEHQIGGITLREWIPRDVTLSRDVDQPTELVLCPCKTCLRICRFTPPELLTSESTTAGGIRPVNQTEPPHEIIRQLYRLFGVMPLPLLDPPPERRNVDQNYTNRPSQTTRARDPGAMGRLPLLERPVPKMRAITSPVKKRFRLPDEEQYVLDCDMDYEVSENVYGTVNGLESDVWMATRNAQRKRLRQSADGSDQSDNKRVNHQSMAGGTDGQHSDMEWWLKPNPWTQGELMLTGSNLPTWHTNDHDWRRPQDQIDVAVHTLYDDIAERFTLDDVSKLDGRGDEIVLQMVGVHPEFCAVREFEMRDMQPQIEFVETQRHLFPGRADHLIDVMRKGSKAEYIGEPPLPPRTRGLPYKMKDADNTILSLAKLWKGVYKKRMFLRTTKTISLGESIESTPTTAVEKKTRTCQ